MIDKHRLLQAHETVRRELLARRTREGHWVGELSASALSTATAISALSLMVRGADDPIRRETCSQYAARGVAWLARCQNPDGGWGDTDRSFSNISTTMLVRSAFALAGAADAHSALMERADKYIAEQGGVEGIRRRYGDDKTFAVPILTNAALAGLVAWREVAPLPFELACLPFSLLPRLRLPVVSYAVPALVAIGQAKFFHDRPRNPLRWLLRRLTVGLSARRLVAMQPASGGYLEAVPLTSFVVMSLAATGRASHVAARRGMAFLFASAQPDGSWPIDTNLATWNTTLSVGALASASGDVGALGCLDWLLGCQHRRRHPFTDAAPGGWGWTDLSGAVPDADDTAGALLALRVLQRSTNETNRRRIEAAAAGGVGWLLDLQNGDGGWPTFCRGWGTLPFDRSGTDLTAHAIRAVAAWRDLLGAERVDRAIARGFEFLDNAQRPDGSWTPLWFGNQHFPGEENPLYGTARVLLAYRDLERIGAAAARRGLEWLAANQGPDGGWGAWPGGSAPSGPAGAPGVEETSAAVEALLAGLPDPALEPAVDRGVRWLVEAVESGRHRQPSPIGLYFARLWYYETLYPMTFSLSALGQAVRHFAVAPAPETEPTHPPVP